LSHIILIADCCADRPVLNPTPTYPKDAACTACRSLPGDAHQVARLRCKKTVTGIGAN